MISLTVLVTAAAALAGCDDAGHTDERVDAAASGAASVTAAGAATSLHRDASRPPGLRIGTTTIWLNSTSMADVGAGLGMRGIAGDSGVHDPTDSRTTWIEMAARSSCATRKASR